jgi:hypothetical protein
MSWAAVDPAAGQPGEGRPSAAFARLTGTARPPFRWLTARRLALVPQALPDLFPGK